MNRLTDYDGNTTTYTHDVLGRVDTATYADGTVADFDYDAAGNRDKLTLAGIYSVGYTYDAANRLASLVNTAASGQVLSSFGYQYDKADNLTTKVDAGGTTVYGYDSLNRLATVTLPGGGEVVYAYDSVGNRDWMTDATGITDYVYNDANQLTEVTSPTGTKAFTWDKNGNQLSDGEATYVYDSLDRLAQVATGTEQVRYQYDGDGLLVERAAGQDTVRFYLDNQHVINEADASGVIAASMFRGAGIYLGRQVGNDPAAYYVYNGHGDVVGLADGAGALFAAYEYDPFGVLTSTTAGVSNPFLYAGEYYDAATDQYYLRARFYSPSLGRFITQDTWKGSPWQPWTQNLYTYVGNNPVNYVDPSGHSAEPANRHQIVPPDMAGMLNALLMILSMGLMANEQDDIARDVARDHRVQDWLGTDFDTQYKALDERHADACKLELLGTAVAYRKDGKPYDHCRDVFQDQTGLKNMSDAIRNKLRDPNILPGTSNALSQMLIKVDVKLAGSMARFSDALVTGNRLSTWTPMGVPVYGPPFPGGTP